MFRKMTNQTPIGMCNKITVGKCIDIEMLKRELIERQLVCSECGFPKDIPREPVLIKNDIFSLMRCEKNTCNECGHQKDGTTIPIVKKTIQEIVRRQQEQHNLKIVRLQNQHDDTDRKSVV